MERPDPKQVLGRLLGPGDARSGCDECFASSTAMSSSSSQEPTQMRPRPACVLICPAARPVARITKASARSSGLD